MIGPVMIGPLGFVHPWLLLGLLVLPLLWVLLRAVPPVPIRRRFPAIVLLLGLTDAERQSDRTPWWLILLRALAVAALVIGFAGPILNPEPEAGNIADGQGSLLVLVDATWADAPVWDEVTRRARAAVEAAGRAGRPVALMRASGEADAGFGLAQDTLARLPGFTPQPWGIRGDLPLPDGDFTTLWISDGVGWPARADLLARLKERGAVRVAQPAHTTYAITGVALEGPETEAQNTTQGAADLSVRVASLGAAEDRSVKAIGPDPSGVVRVLSSAPVTAGSAALDLPLELRNRVSRLTVSGAPSAGGTWLTGTSLQRLRVGLVAGRQGREAAELLSPLHYLRQALAPHAELTSGTLIDQLEAGPDAMVLSDVANLVGPEQERLTEWVAGGGLLIRFAGPSMAASENDVLLPVRLRAGGRNIGGALSWSTPKQIAPFDADSVFYGLDLPADVHIRRQVLAEPGPDLDARVIARLEDGTPLVTRRAEGAGQVVLFHISANAEWSDLPLSGLFVEMLTRLLASAGSGTLGTASLDLEGAWQLTEALDAAGGLAEAPARAPVDGARLAAVLEGAEAPGPDLPPGIWRGSERVVAVNAAQGMDLIAASWPADVPVVGGAETPARPLGGVLLALALGIFCLDMLAALALTGRLRGGAVSVLAACAMLWLAPGGVRAQEQSRAVEASSGVHLAYVTTGDARIDETSRAGLYGLSNALYRRTAIEPGLPMAVDIEKDELVFFPLLYWPVTEDQPLPSAEAVARLNRYLRGGGMIVFDTRDADLAGGGESPAARRLRAIAAPLAIPPLAPLPADHVLTRSFYLLSEFPGRYAGGGVWVEATPDAVDGDAQSFRDLTDGVTPVVIGGADWSGAWATDQIGAPLLPVGRGAAGERQRELALRFGVNLVMHVLTGNYKSDQVHVPALLDRLGQEGRK